MECNHATTLEYRVIEVLDIQRCLYTLSVYRLATPQDVRSRSRVPVGVDVENTRTRVGRVSLELEWCRLRGVSRRGRDPKRENEAKSGSVRLVGLIAVVGGTSGLFGTCRSRPLPDLSSNIGAAKCGVLPALIPNMELPTLLPRDARRF